MNNLTRFFLVLLRLAIGWLFLVEGYEKVFATKPWTSAGYLQQSAGPLSSFFQWQGGGNADALALERLTVRPLAADEEPAAVPDHSRASPALVRDWQEYTQRFSEHYQLTDEQRKVAEGKLEQSLASAVRWMLDDTTKKEMPVNTEFAAAPYTPKKTPAQRIREYRAKVEEYRRAEEEVLPAFGKDVYKEKLRAMKADASQMRTSLLGDLDTILKDSLSDILTDEQKKMPALAAAPPPLVLRVTDALVSWGLLVTGTCLLLGLLTRLNCLGGAWFLVMLYLALPAWPWLPENIKAEGHYLFVNKNLILALALLALATTRSGEWFGLDSLLCYLNPWRRRELVEANGEAHAAAVSAHSSR